MTLRPQQIIYASNTKISPGGESERKACGESGEKWPPEVKNSKKWHTRMDIFFRFIAVQLFRLAFNLLASLFS